MYKQTDDPFTNLFNSYVDSVAKGDEENGVASILLKTELEKLSKENYSYIIVGSDGLFIKSHGKWSTINFRASGNAFFAITAISHIFPAISSIVRTYNIDPNGYWEIGAIKLSKGIQEAKNGNSLNYWKNGDSQVAKYYTDQIKNMVDYALTLAEDYLTKMMDKATREKYMDYDFFNKNFFLNDEYNSGIGYGKVSVSTFNLGVTEGISKSIASIQDANQINWQKTIAVQTGQMGRPSAGLTSQKQQYISILKNASEGQLDYNKLLVSPYTAAKFSQLNPFKDDGSVDTTVLDQILQIVLAQAVPIYSQSTMANLIIKDSPNYLPEPFISKLMHKDQDEITYQPQVKDPEDWNTWYTKIKLAWQNPENLMSSTVSNYVIEELFKNNNDFKKVAIPAINYNFVEATKRFGELAYT